MKTYWKVLIAVASTLVALFAVLYLIALGMAVQGYDDAIDCINDGYFEYNGHTFLCAPVLAPRTEEGASTLSM